MTEVLIITEAVFGFDTMETRYKTVVIRQKEFYCRKSERTQNKTSLIVMFTYPQYIFVVYYEHNYYNYKSSFPSPGNLSLVSQNYLAA